MLCGCCPRRSQQLSSKPGIHLQGWGSRKAHMVLSSCSQGCRRHCMAGPHPTHPTMGAGLGQSVPAFSCLHLPIAGPPCHRWGREWAGDISPRGTAASMELSSLPQSRAATSKARRWPCLLPAPWLQAAGIQRCLLTRDKKQMLKPQTFVIIHSSVPLYHCCSIRLLVLIGFRMMIVIIIPCDVVPEV